MYEWYYYTSLSSLSIFVEYFCLLHILLYNFLSIVLYILRSDMQYWTSDSDYYYNSVIYHYCLTRFFFLSILDNCLLFIFLLYISFMLELLLKLNQMIPTNYYAFGTHITLLHSTNHIMSSHHFCVHHVEQLQIIDLG